MNIDAFSSTGELHRGNFCQDYFRFGITPKPYIIVSDGCSSSPDTDIGARILVSCAEKLLGTMSNPDFITDGIMYAAIMDAKEIIKTLGLNEACLDATLLVALFNPNAKRLAFSMTGDGFVFWKNANKVPSIIKVEYTENAPYYPSVLIGGNFGNWKKAFPNNKLVVKQLFYDSLQLDNEPLEPEIFNGIMDTSDLEYFGLSSDGLASFVNDQGQQVPSENIFSQILDFKSMVGSFVQRKMNRIIKDNKAKGIINGDDISIAIMNYFGD